MMTLPDWDKNDKVVSLLDRRLRVLFRLQPANLKGEQKKFCRLKNYNPQFRYPHLTESLKNTNQLIKQIQINVSPLGQIFYLKKQEFIKILSLLQNIGQDKKFCQASIELFQKPSPNLIRQAKSIIKHAITAYQSPYCEMLTDTEIQNCFNQIFNQLNLPWQAKIIKTLLAQLTTQYFGRKIKIKKGIKLNKEEIKCLINHELVHIFRYENGCLQPYKIFSSGLANYLVWEEGLACYHESLQDCFSQRLCLFAARVLAAHLAQRYSFCQTYQKLIQHNLLPEIAWTTTMRAKRGLKNTALPGAFTKDHLYLKGYLSVKKYLKTGKSLNQLMIGKISAQDLNLIKKIPNIKKPKYVLKKSIF